AVLIGGLAVLGYAGAQGGDYVRREFFGVIEDLAMAPVRNGAACVVAGAAIVVVAVVGGAMSRRSALAINVG
ncbi:MAG TPA: hypothetical protein VJP07_07155, partial [Dehalococcoidia bacterium]|nr:hypothetical protein [Dehalococcoidia bacterium]